MRIGLLTAMVALATPVVAAEPGVPTSKEDKISYSIGVDIGTSMKRQGLELNADQMAAGLKDSLSGGKTKLSADEVKKILTDYQQELQAKAQEHEQMLAEKNKKDGEAFLAENKKKPGVKTLPSGLQYKVITDGKGPIPKASDTVTTNYKGTLIDGTEFDSSYKRGEPATFPVSGVIKGWTEALQMMKVGSKWELYVPPDLAYGPRGAGQVIGPNSTLVFEVELLSIGDKSAGDKSGYSEKK
ncbi:MAG TPA: FKBP-type peptidyl-prolyl cis-trans isomerase [Nitrospiria bacterium]|nr:FKBP-type peptidyl-prolyl cis-trans isomerase [Nitrospiria bacterium]